MSSCSTYPTPFSRLMALSVLLAAFFCTPLSARAGEMLSVDKSQASTKLDFAIVIPAVLRILEDSHPAALFSADTTGSLISATQRMVLVSTLGKGFCMDLQLNQQQVAGWQLNVSGSAGTRVEAADGGYRVCALRPGRFELALQHAFSLKERKPGADALASNFSWPVSVSLVTP
jgi:hypothetical protein